MIERSGYNSVRLLAFLAGSSTRIDGTNLEQASEIRFTSLYPGGLFGELTFRLPWPVATPWVVKPHDRLTAWNKLTMVWEGEVVGLDYVIGRDERGINVTCYGYWSTLLMARQWRKPWADTRIEDSVWIWDEAASAAEKCGIDRNNRIRFTPKSIRDAAGAEVGWLQYETAEVIYTAPTGETIKRVTWNYDLQEGAQQWALSLYNVTSAATVVAITATGTGSQDQTLATPASAVKFVFYADANQTPATDGTMYGEVSSVVVYTETGSINLTEIAKDVRAKVTELSAYEGLIGSNTLSLVPFVSEGESIADLLTRAAGFGDSGYNAWAVGIRESTAGTDDKPVLFVELVAAKTDYDYRLDLTNCQPTNWQRDTSEVRNWIAVRYRADNGPDIWVTPDDDANLKDDTSITAYGRREEWLDIDTTSETTAKSYARRFLAMRKDPQWISGSGIPVVGRIMGASGKVVPASEIRAGKRVRIENFLGDISGTGMTLLITQAEYSDQDETTTISFGQPDRLEIWLARQAAQIGTGATEFGGRRW